MNEHTRATRHNKQVTTYQFPSFTEMDRKTGVNRRTFDQLRRHSIILQDQINATSLLVTKTLNLFHVFDNPVHGSSSKKFYHALNSVNDVFILISYNKIGLVPTSQ